MFTILTMTSYDYDYDMHIHFCHASDLSDTPSLELQLRYNTRDWCAKSRS